MKSVAIIGPQGQLGTDLVKSFRGAGWRVVLLTHQNIQVEEIQSVRQALRDIPVDWIINTAAFHKVDECELDSERAWLINASGPANVAQVANELGSKSVFISSDYVFAGNKVFPNSYSESDRICPINVYGHSKAAGELATLSANPLNLVVRISSVFGAAGSSGKGGNFVETILSKARVGSKISIVNDIHMSPTYTVDAAEKILSALNSSCSGFLHASNNGSTTWFNFGERILDFAGLRTPITATKTDLNQPIKRPINSTFDVTKSESLTGFVVTWEDGLRRYLIEKGHIR